MPAQYEAIRNSLVRKGTDYDRAQAIAAATYNKITGRSVQSAMKKNHEGKHSRGGKTAALRREME